MTNWGIMQQVWVGCSALWWVKRHPQGKKTTGINLILWESTLENKRAALPLVNRLETILGVRCQGWDHHAINIFFCCLHPTLPGSESTFHSHFQVSQQQYSWILQLAFPNRSRRGAVEWAVGQIGCFGREAGLKTHTPPIICPPLSTRWLSLSKAIVSASRVVCRDKKGH